MRMLGILLRLIVGAGTVLFAAVALVSASPLAPSQAGKAPGTSPAAAAAAAAGRPDNPRPPRNLTKMQPDQFDVITSRKDLIGTQWRHIVVLPDRIHLRVGDQQLWSGTFRSVPKFDGVVSMADIAKLVARSPSPDWLREIEPGVFLLQVGLTQSPGTTVKFAAPEAREIRLASAPYVYISGVGANASFRGVTVRSWLPDAGRPDTDATHSRPFVSYDEGGRLDIVDSELSHLGSDSNKAYGVSWGTATTGQAVSSVFHHNLFGAYTSKAVGVAFRSNVFRDNAIYGLDPHTSSYDLLAVDNEAYGNNSHGIIFSERVHNSVVERNRSHHNGGNGIMMDENCDFNVIRNNEVWSNRSDGIVIQGSSQAMVTDNTVTANEVGVRVNANELGATSGTLISGNRLSENKRGIEVYGGARDTLTQLNVVRDSDDQALVFSEPATSHSDTVNGAQKGVVVVQSATLRGLTTDNVDRAVVLVQGARATIESGQLSARDTAVDMEGPGTLQMLPGSTGEPTVLAGARKGVEISGTADLLALTIRDVDRGVLVAPGSQASIRETLIVARGKGVEVEKSAGPGRVSLAYSDIRAPEPVVGTAVRAETSNALSVVPSWLAIAGALFVGLAMFLQLGHRFWSPMSTVRHKVVPLAAGGGRRNG